MRLFFSSWIFSFAIAACSSSSIGPSTADTTDGGVDGFVPSDAGASDAPVDTGPEPINGCTPADFAANDHTAEADSRIIQAPIDKTATQFSPHCMRVKVDQLVTWQGDLADHPLHFVLDADGSGPDAGSFTGTLGAPDGSPDIDTMIAHQPGSIAFTCSDHPAIMFGAVQVVP